MVYATPYLATTPRSRVRALYFPTCRHTTGTIQSRILGPKLNLLMHSRRIQVIVVQAIHWHVGRWQAQNMVNYRVHMEPFSRQHYILHRAYSPLSNHYISRDHPNTHELTNHILHPSPATGALKEVAHHDVLRNGFDVTNKNYQKFPQDILDGDDVENRLPVVKLVYNRGPINLSQPVQ